MEPCAVQSWIDPLKLFDECAGLCAEVLDQPESAREAIMEKAASYFYWQTGFRWPGCCERTAKPCWEDCGGCSGGWSIPQMIGGQWINNKCCGCNGYASACEDLSLPLLPVPKTITSVTVDGVTLDPSAYVCTSSGIAMTDGSMWPSSGSCIVYEGGAEPPEWVACAAREYARELMCQCWCPAKCKLPTGWKQADFGDITVTSSDYKITPSIDLVLSDPLFKLPSGRPRVRSQVWSPDVQSPTVGYPS